MSFAASLLKSNWWVLDDFSSLKLCRVKPEEEMGKREQSDNPASLLDERKQTIGAKNPSVNPVSFLVNMSFYQISFLSFFSFNRCSLVNGSLLESI